MMTYHYVNTKGIVQLKKIQNMCFGVHVGDSFEMFTFCKVTFHKLVFKRRKKRPPRCNKNSINSFLQYNLHINGINKLYN